MDTEYGFGFQQYLLKKTNILAIIDSDFKAFENANINTVITLFKGRKGCNKDLIFARCHSRYGDCDISLYSLDINLFIRYVICKYFLPFCQLPFYSVDSVAQKF